MKKGARQHYVPVPTCKAFLDRSALSTPAATSSSLQLRSHRACSKRLPPLPHSSPSQQHQPRPQRRSPKGTALGVAGKPQPLCSHSMVLGFERKPNLRAQNASRSRFSSQHSRAGTSTAAQMAVVPAQVSSRPQGALGVHIRDHRECWEDALLRSGGRGNPSTNHATRKELPVTSTGSCPFPARSGTRGLELRLQERPLLQSISLLHWQGLNLPPQPPPSTVSFGGGKPTAKPRTNRQQPKHRLAAALAGSRRGVSPYRTGTDNPLPSKTIRELLRNRFLNCP